ncbi:deazaflavin-dependent nitroreductase [Streptomyces sp. CB01635]|uniref:nitroreductase family deazaflavin-dependent oxidoreductase n=1 Tax=unclassified Streptomyces TaxID=2593676 RepID=UPI000C276569|nr:nitroreductase family deazaflavin-dependent oxidoreductase [Streptomyces sp. CB01635]PJN06225.1 deazaflavin-dependent nitroreductase [Streptomyces sp. CB01635]
MTANAQSGSPSSPSPYYLKGSRLNVRLNGVIGWLARHGVSLMGSAELSVRGRKSGQMQRIPVNPHTYKDAQYIVSARGHSQWVRNMRVAGAGELRVGRKVRTFTATEVPDNEKLPILRSYLEKWGWEVNQYFQGITAKSTDEELTAAAPDHPVFLITIEK